MSNTASASKMQKNFGAYHDQALSEPVRVTKYGRETVYIISATVLALRGRYLEGQKCRTDRTPS